MSASAPTPAPALDQPRTVLSWALYDWANSAFACTVMAGFFPLFFKAYWADPADPVGSTFWLGIANSSASVVIALIAPMLGAIADRGSLRKRFLLVFAFLGVVMTGGLWTVAQGQWELAVFFYVSATIGFMGGNTFYDSLLVDVASEPRRDRVSSIGYALGYIGGGLLFAVNVLMYLKPALFGISDGATAIKLSFLTVAIWWALFTIPLIAWVREPQRGEQLSVLAAARGGLQELVATARMARELRVVGLFLLAYWLYIDGVDTIVRMAVDYGMSLGLDSSALITALLLVQFIAFPATLAYAWFASKIGTKQAVLVAIVAYGLITIFAFFMATEAQFYGLAAGVGLFQGGIQALSRSLYGRLIPASKSAAFYGLYNMLGKFAAVLGPVMIGVVAKLSGSTRYGLLSVIVLFIAGGLLLVRVDIEAGAALKDKLA